MAVSRIPPAPKPQRFIEPHAPEKIELIEDLLDRFDIDSRHRTMAGAEIAAAIRKACHLTERSRETRAMLAEGRRLCAACDQYMPEPES